MFCVFAFRVSLGGFRRVNPTLSLGAAWRPRADNEVETWEFLKLHYYVSSE